MYKETQHTRFLSVSGEAEMCIGLFTDGEIETVGYCVVLMLELSHGFYLSRKSLTRHNKGRRQAYRRNNDRTIDNRAGVF